jgi:hypothetical protein
MSDLEREAALARAELAAFRRHVAANPPENATQAALASARARELVDAVDRATDALERSGTARLMSPQEYVLQRRAMAPCGCLPEALCEQHQQAAPWRGYRHAKRSRS